MKQPDRSSCTIKDIAEQSGVSLSTVSLVMNDNPRISPATRARVRRTIERLGYQPNHIARSLARRRAHTLCVLVPQLRHTFADVYFGEIVSGIYDQASKLGHKVMLDVARPEFIEKREHLQIIEQKMVDGVLFIGANTRHRFVQDFLDRPETFLMVNCYSRDHDLNHVVSNYRSGARQVTEHLVRLGHKQIGFIGGGLADIVTSQDIFATFKEVLAQHQITFDETRQLTDGLLTEEGGRQAAVQLLRANPDLTAIFALNDKMAIGALRALNELGRRCPEDIALIGYDDIPAAAYTVPALTTVRQPLYEIGKIACERLIDLVHGKIHRVQEVLPAELLIRESCGARAVKNAHLPV